jgi:CBS-domain-containing membrane protein
MLARDIMTRSVITISPDATIHDAARLLSQHNISGVPVVDASGKMVGLVSEADLISKQGQQVADIMSRRIVSVHENTPVDEIAQLLIGRNFKRIPIVRNEKVIGVVSRADIVRMMAARWVCELCGAVQQGRRPGMCADCGADATHIEREFAPRLEITERQ